MISTPKKLCLDVLSVWIGFFLSFPFPFKRHNGPAFKKTSQAGADVPWTVFLIGAGGWWLAFILRVPVILISKALGFFLSKNDGHIFFWGGVGPGNVW